MATAGQQWFNDTIIGYRKDGRPIYQIQGGAEEEQKPADKPDEQKPADPPKVEPRAGEKLEDLPDWAQKLVKDTRAEAARDRTEAATKAGEAASAKVISDIAKALGITKGEADKLTPAQLQEKLTASEGAKAEGDRELALWRVADDLNVKAGKLLDSRKFMSSIGSVAASDTGKLKALVEEAVKADPSLRSGTGQAPGSSSVDHTGRPGGETRKQAKSLQDAVSASYANRK